MTTLKKVATNQWRLLETCIQEWRNRHESGKNEALQSKASQGCVSRISVVDANWLDPCVGLAL